MARLTVSETGLALIAAFEGFRAESLPLSDGRWTVGYGSSHTANGTVSVTEPEAKALLKRDLEPIADLLNDSSFSPLNQNQFDALSSLAFNIGINAFRSSDVFEHIRRGEPIAAAMAMDNWCTANLESRPLVVDVLVRRRAAEKALFLSLPAGAVAAPSPLLVPVSKTQSASALPVWDWQGAMPAPPDDASAPIAGDVTPNAEQGAEDAPKDKALLPSEVSPQELAAAAFTRRLDVLVGPEAISDETTRDETSPNEEPVSDPGDEPEQGTENVQTETAIEAGSLLETEVPPSAQNETEAPTPFPIEVEAAGADTPAEPVQAFTETVLPAQDNSAPIEAIAPDADTKTTDVAIRNDDEIVPPAAAVADVASAAPATAPAAKPQSFLVQGLIVLGGVLLLLWSYATGGFQPVAPGTPVSQNVALLYAIAGACLIGVGGYFLLRPPREN